MCPLVVPSQEKKGHGPVGRGKLANVKFIHWRLIPNRHGLLDSNFDPKLTLDPKMTFDHKMTRNNLWPQMTPNWPLTSDDPTLTFDPKMTFDQITRIDIWPQMTHSWPLMQKWHWTPKDPKMTFDPKMTVCPKICFWTQMTSLTFDPNMTFVLKWPQVAFGPKMTFDPKLAFDLKWPKIDPWPAVKGIDIHFSKTHCSLVTFCESINVFFVTKNKPKDRCSG